LTFNIPATIAHRARLEKRVCTLPWFGVRGQVRALELGDTSPHSKLRDSFRREQFAQRGKISTGIIHFVFTCE
jgi:hypothetical protein